MLDIFYYPAMIFGYLVLGIITISFVYVMLCILFEHLAGTKALDRRIEALVESNRNLLGVIGELRYKVEKYQRTKEYHKEGTDGQNT